MKRENVWRVRESVVSECVGSKREKGLNVWGGGENNCGGRESMGMGERVSVRGERE